MALQLFAVIDIAVCANSVSDVSSHYTDTDGIVALRGHRYHR
jgi:hypothetical protein